MNVSEIFNQSPDFLKNDLRSVFSIFFTDAKNNDIADLCNNLFKSAVKQFYEFELNVEPNTFKAKFNWEFNNYFLKNKNKLRALVELNKDAFTDLSNYANVNQESNNASFKVGYQGFDAINDQLNFRSDSNKHTSEKTNKNKKEGFEILMQEITSNIDDVVRGIIFRYCITIY